MSISVADLLCDLKVQIEGLREKKLEALQGVVTCKIQMLQKSFVKLFQLLEHLLKTAKTPSY